MNAETQTTISTDKKRRKRLASYAFIAILILGMLIMASAILPLIGSYINDYCYLESLMLSKKEMFEPDIELEKSKKLPGWQERVKIMEEAIAEPDPNETWYHSFIISFCPAPGTERKPAWLSKFEKPEEQTE